MPVSIVSGFPPSTGMRCSRPPPLKTSMLSFVQFGASKRPGAVCTTRRSVDDTVIVSSVLCSFGCAEAVHRRHLHVAERGGLDRVLIVRADADADVERILQLHLHRAARQVQLLAGACHGDVEVGTRLQ